MTNPQVALITGSSTGIGLGIACELARKNYSIALNAPFLNEELEAAMAKVQKLGVPVIAAAFDVTDIDQHTECLSNIESQLGPLTTLVNNAGVMPLSLLEKGRTDEWDHMIDVNIKGVLYGIDSVYQHMLERESGQIINISSVAGKRVMPGSAVYSGTKYAVRAISEGLRLESSGKIQVTCIYPGAFKTELAFSIKDESMLEALMSRGIGNIAQPAERVAESIIYALQLDPGVSVNEIVIRPTAQEA